MTMMCDDVIIKERSDTVYPVNKLTGEIIKPVAGTFDTHDTFVVLMLIL